MPRNSGSPSEPIDPGPLKKRIGYMLRLAQLAVLEQAIDTFEPFGLRPQEYSVLLLVEHAPGRNQSAIGEALRIQRANFVGLIQDLEDRGLVRRSRGVDDMRVRVLHLTRSGKALLGRAKRADADLSKQLARKLDGQHRACLTHLRILADLD
jgi:DNA-binding MarR family transcriptional regulator